MPTIEKRRKSKREEHEAGQGTSKIADTIGWMDEAAKGRPYDVALSQLGLAVAAIHTTTETACGLIDDLCASPEWFEPLRREMAEKFNQNGWSKKSLHEMQLVHSAMKESQRHHFGDVGKQCSFPGPLNSWH